MKIPSPALSCRKLCPAFALVAALASPATAEPAAPAPIYSNPPPTAKPAVAKAPTRLTAEQLQADFVVFRRAYQELHPGLYRYNTPARMDANFRDLRGRLGHGQTLQEAFVSFDVFLARVRCGHSYENFLNQPAPVAAELFGGRDRTPFYFRWIGRCMIVTRNFSGDARLDPGAEVLSLNGVAAGRVLRRLMTIARADGSNDAKRVNYLEVRGDSRNEAFDVFYPMFFPVKEGRFVMKVRPAQRRGPVTVRVAAATPGQRAAACAAQTEGAGGDRPLWEFRRLDGRTAYLRMPTWALFNTKWDWKAFQDRTFDTLAAERTGAQVDDLQPSGQFRRWTRYRTVPAALRPYLDTWDSSFLDWGADAAGPRRGFYRMTRFDGEDGGGVRASARPYRGRVCVLIDASNNSATFEFARAVKDAGLATLVGQTTRGSRRGINGGAFFFLTLPHSRIEIDLPLVGL